MASLYKPSAEKNYALLVAGSDYLRYPPIAVTKKDLKAIETILRDPQYCAYHPEHVHVVWQEQATVDGFRNALTMLAQTVPSDATVFIYFSGHGGRVLEESGWIPYLCLDDADPFQLQQTALSGQEFSTALAAIRARRLVVMIDACHASGSATFKGRNNWRQGLPDDYYQSLSLGNGRVIIASSSEDQYSYIRDQNDRSAFTYYLEQAMKGKAAVRGDGLVHILDVFHYVNEQVRHDFPSQTPILKVQTMDLNFSVALDRGARFWKGTGATEATSPIEQIRTAIRNNPLAGAHTLSEHLRSLAGHGETRDAVDEKIAHLEQLAKKERVIGLKNDEKVERHESIYFFFQVCRELEAGEE